MKRGTPIYYAQVKTPRGLPPIARVLVGVYAHPGRRPKTHRILFPHTRFGLDVNEHWMTDDIHHAAALLQKRVNEEIAHHRYQIELLELARHEQLNTLVIAWPTKKLP